MASPKRIRSAHVGVDCLRAAPLASLFSCIFPLALLSQTAQQQRVHGSSSVTTTTSILPAYNKDSSTGALSLLAGAPFADRLEGGLIAIDGQGKFLFELNPASDNISMFQIDGSTGALETWISICWRRVPWRLESFRSRISGPVCCIFRA